jgi:uncharacterized membrane protein (DUF485 family)
MKSLNMILRILGATLVLLLLLPFQAVVLGDAPSFAMSGWSVLSSLLIVLVLALVAWNSSQWGWRLSATVFLIYFGINILNTEDEAILFKVGLEARQSLLMIGAGLIITLVFAPAFVWILGKWSGSPGGERVTLAPRSAFGWAWRIVTGDLAYIFCYFVAGMMVFPFVKDFYSSTTLPEPGIILTAQFLRGLVYVGAGLAVASGMAGKRRQAMLVLALAFPVLAGVAPLIVPGPYMPGPVRLAHGIEIGVSNFVYGVILALLLTRKTQNPAGQTSRAPMAVGAA